MRNKIAVSYIIDCLYRMVFKYLIEMNSVSAKNLFFGCRIRLGYVLIMIVLIGQYSSTLSGHLSKPMNTVSVVGNRAKLECSRNPSIFPINWEFASTGSNNFSYIYISQRIPKNHSSRYKIDTDNNTRYDIVIDSIDLSYAGTYRCTSITEEVINASSDSAELIVLVSDPVCNTNASAFNESIVEGDYIRMWCIVNYSGDWIPVMEWTRNNGQTVDANVFYTNTSTTVTSSLITRLTSYDNGVTFTCKTSMRPLTTFSRTMKTGEAIATNIPHYQHLWNFTANVLYGPRNLTIESHRDSYEVGDRLMCLADGNPSPTFQWTVTGTSQIIEGSILTIDNTMALMQKLTFKCTATNTVADESKDIVTTTMKGTPDWPKAATIAIIVAGIIFVIALLVLGLGAALTVKACTKGNSVNPRNSHEPSIEHQDYEIVAEPNAPSSNPGNPPPNQTTANEGITESHSAGNINCEGYASLKRSSPATFVQPAVYTPLQLYANASSIDN